MFLSDARNTGLSPYLGPAHSPEIAWATRLPASSLVPPVLDQHGRSFWVLADGTCLALSPDGTILWQKTLSAPIHSSPALSSDGQTLYTAARDGVVTALTTQGEVLWTRDVGERIISSPVLDEQAHRVILSVLDTTWVFDARTGRVLFTFEANTGTYNSSPALGPDGLIHISSWSGWVSALSAEGEVVWKTPTGGNHREKHSFFTTAPLVGPFGMTYVATHNGQLLAFNPKGRPIWSQKAGGNVLAFLAMLPSGAIVVPVQHQGLSVIGPDKTILWQRPLTPPFQASGLRFGFALSISRDGVIFTTATSRVKRGTSTFDVSTLWSIDGDTGAVLDVLPLQHHTQSGPVLGPPYRGQPQLFIGTMDGYALCIRSRGRADRSVSAPTRTE